MNDLNLESGEFLSEEPAQDLQEGDFDNKNNDSVADSNESVGGSDSSSNDSSESNSYSDDLVVDSELPEGIKARIGRQEKRHQREMRALEDEISRMRSAVNENKAAGYSGISSELDNSQVFDGKFPEVNPYTGLPINDDTIEGIVQKQLFAYEASKQRLERQKVAHRDREELSEFQREFFSSISEASDKYSDFDDVVGKSINKITNEMQTAAQFISNPGDILYSLSKNTAELDRINKLPKFKQMKEVVRYAEAFNARLNQRKVTKAPSPVSQSKGSSKSVIIDPSKLSYAEISRRERERQRRN